MKRYSSNLIALLVYVWIFLFTAPLFAGDGFLSEEDLFEEDISTGLEINDPLESINRLTFRFNDFVYLKVMQPVADVYQAVTPDPIEQGATNIFHNLKYPVRLAGNLLQGRWQGAWVESGRFVINSTIGVLGAMKPADKISGFEPIPEEDIGQALGSWGIGEGFYLVLPVLGPSNMRDLVGLVGNRAVNPLDEPYSLIDDWNWEWQAALLATETTVNSPDLLKQYRYLKGSAIDPYSSLKNGYTQLRRAAVVE